MPDRHLGLPVLQEFGEMMKGPSLCLVSRKTCLPHGLGTADQKRVYSLGESAEISVGEEYEEVWHGISTCEQLLDMFGGKLTGGGQARLRLQRPRVRLCPSHSFTKVHQAKSRRIYS